MRATRVARRARDRVNRGLLVIGADLAADVTGTAAQLAQGLRRAGEAVRVQRAIALGDRDAEGLHAYAALASPVIAARHEGETLDPVELVRELRDGGGALVASLPGGMLAALTTRYTVRDLAAELGLPVVLAVPATPDATNLVRLSIAAARAARLTVVAVILTGWPDPPEPRPARRAPAARRDRRDGGPRAARVPGRARRRHPRLAGGGLDPRGAAASTARAAAPAPRRRRPRPPAAPVRRPGAAAPSRSSPTGSGRRARPATRAPHRARGSWRRCSRSSPPRGRCARAAPTRSTTGRAAARS